MLLQIPQVLTPQQVAHCRDRLGAAAWADGRITAGHQSALAKDNAQVPENDPVARELGGMVLDALSRNPTFFSAALPQRIYPPLFNRYAGGQSFGFHVGLFFAFQQPGEDLPPLGAVIEQENRRMAVRAAWSDYFERNDVFVCPTNFTPAFPHDARPFDERTIATPDGERPYAQQPFWIAHASLPGLPAVAAPVGRTPGGLPVGVQILGPLYEDDTAITFAELLADLTGGFQPPPI